MYDFVVTELSQVSRGQFQDTPVEFKWNAARQSGPRGWWPNPLKLRTTREDYPGSDIPSEQVLGPNFEPFTIEGIWDNRYNDRPGNSLSANFAEDTWRAFEAMVQRGNMVRLQFGGVQIHGLITQFTPTFMQTASQEADVQGFYRIGYKFTLSPHFRKVGGDLADARAKKALVPQGTKDPSVFVDSAAALQAQQRFLHGEMPAYSFSTTSYGDVGTALDDIDRLQETSKTIVEQRVIPLTGATSIARLASNFKTIETGSAQDIINLIAAARAADNLLHPNDAIGELSFEVWKRQMSAVARALAYSAHKAAEDLASRVLPDALALYRPHQGESLYAISQRFYKTPHGWRDIAARNNLKTFTLDGTELLVIPQRAG